MIFLSTLKLVLDTYFVDSKNDSYEKFSIIVDMIFTTLFTLEALIKTISMGFVSDEGSYLRDGWN